MPKFTISPPDESAAFEELSIIIKELPRFALVFAICASDNAAVNHIKKWVKLHPEIEVEPFQVRWADRAIDKHLISTYDATKPQAIFVYGMDLWTERGDDAKSNAFTVTLNHGRDYLRDHVQCPVVFFCTPTVYNFIRRNAQDFYSVATATLRLSIPSEMEDHLSRYRFFPLTSGFSTLSKTDKNEQIAELESLTSQENSASFSVVDHVYFFRYLAGLLLDSARYTEAKNQLERAIGLSENEESIPRLLYGTLLGMRAQIEFAAANFDSAKSFLKQELDIQKAELGHSHPTIAANFHNLALIEQATGDLSAAEKLFEQAFNIRQATIGFNDAQTLASRFGMAQVQMCRGNYAEAQKIYQQVLIGKESLYGWQSADVAVVLADLGLVMTRQHKFTEAKHYLEQALDIQELIGGLNHDETAQMYCNMGELSQATGRYQEAMMYYEQARNLLIRIFGKDSPRVSIIEELMIQLQDVISFGGYLRARLANGTQANSHVNGRKNPSPAKPRSKTLSIKPVLSSSLLSSRPNLKQK